jgi:DNA polymerase-3 subunit gamma/tau
VIESPSPHQAIYRRWRAQTFSEIVGQEAVVETLRNAVRAGRVAHAILFVGPRGTGKTSLARILAKALNCTDLRDGDPCDACPSCVAIREGRALDLVEIDAASNRGIDAVRDLRERINYAPTDLRRKVYILDEAHQITRDGWNALLKSLEEPPPFVTFMFASTHPQEFPPAILSRLQRYDVRRLTVAEIEGKLQRILAADERSAEPGAVALIARLAAGGMRDAESMLDQLLASAGGVLDETRVRDLLGLADGEAVRAFSDALAGGDPATGIRVLDDLEERGRDLRVFLDQVVEALRDDLREALSAGVANGRSAAQIASSARRLAGIDPAKAGLGGLRLQLEVALFAGLDSAPLTTALASTVTSPSPETPVADALPKARPDRAAPPAAESPPKPGETPVPVVSASAAGPAPARVRTPGKPAAEPAQPPRSLAADSPTAESPSTDSSGGAGGTAKSDVPTVVSAQPAAATPATGTQPPTTAVPGPDVDPDLALLRDRWPEIVDYVSQNPAAKPLVSACRPIAVDGKVVTLGFPESQDFLKAAAERRRSNLEEGVGRFLGREVSVRCVATNLELVPPVGNDTDAAFVLSEARRIFADDLVDVGEVG